MDAFRQIFRSGLLALAALICTPNQSVALEVVIATPREDDALRDALRDASLLVVLEREQVTNTQDIVASARADYQRLLTALYELAYYAPVINITLDGREAAGLSPVGPMAGVRRAVIRVDPGPVFRFGEASIGPQAFETELPEGYAKGEFARVEVLRSAAEAGVDGWRTLGHAKAQVSGQEITARHGDARLDAVIRLDPGPKLRFGTLAVTGNDKVRTKRVREIAGLPAGAVYSPEELERAQARLRRSGAFNVVALREAEEIGPGDTLGVTAQVTEAPPRRLSFGAELSSLEGVGLSGLWMHRNLLGGAERLRLDGEVSGIGGSSGGVDYRVGARFERPATFHRDLDYYIDTEFERLEEKTFTSRSYTLESGVVHYASEFREYEYGLGYRVSDTTNAFGRRSYGMFMLPVTATYDYRDKELDPRSGYYLEASLMPFVSTFGTEDGLRTSIDLRGYKTVGPQDRLTFALRGQLGSLVGPSLARAPADFLYFSGGGGTVRGQKFQSLNVDLGGGVEVGGRSFLGLSGEMRVRASGKFSLVGFYDTGYIGTEGFPDGSSGKWHSGAGVGVRYDTGIGPVRLDVAVPVSGPGSESGLEIYIGIGQAF